MSAASLNDFLKKVLNDLENTKSGAYRSLVANRRPHHFEFDSSKVVQEIKKELIASDIPVTSADEAAILRFAKQFKNTLQGRLNGIAKQSGGKVKSDSTTLKFTFTSNTVNNYAGEYSTPGDVFQAIKDFYKEPLSQFFTSVQNYLTEQTFINEETGRTKTKALRTKSGKKRKASGRVLHAGHVDETGIVQSIVADTLNNLVDVVGVVDDQGYKISERDIKTDLDALGINLSIMRDDKTDSHTITLESAKDNMARGREIKKDKERLIKQIKEAIKTTGQAMQVGAGLENLSGSDSIYEKKRKTTLKKVADKFDQIPGAKVKTEDTKVKKSSNKKQTQLSKASATKGAKKGYGAPSVKLKRAKRRPARKPSAASQPLQLMALINNRLPNAIVQNMGDPALNNRSGRFAASVRIINVLQTPKGFPSFGYSYQKNPYQTFEQGIGKQGTLERDPRTLIDKTIREIAAEFAVGRLFTRRL